jgi:hypothetical protein
VRVQSSQSLSGTYFCAQGRLWGKLSAKLIDATPGLPSVSAYLVHFGTLRNIYRLIGYNGNRAYWDNLATHKRWVNLHLENAARLRDALENEGQCATLSTATECLRIENGPNIYFRVAKWRKYAGGRPLRWTIMTRVKLPKGWVVALRLGENNEQILDYLLLPSVSLAVAHRLFWFSEATRPVHQMERFETFEGLSWSLVKRICKAARSAEVGGRPKLKHRAKKRKIVD